MVSDFRELTDDVTLIHGDTYAALPKLPNGCADLVVVDMPYGVTGLAWDQGAHKTGGVPNLSAIDEWRRVCRDNATILIFGTEPFCSYWRCLLVKGYRNDFIWIKDNSTGHLNCKRKPMANYEQIMVFAAHPDVRKSDLVYNPQMTPGKPYSSRRSGSASIYRRNHRTSSDNETGLRYPVRTLYYGYDDARFHETQKPVPLLEYLIRTYSDPGDVVLDPFAGSGSTGVAAINAGRKFVGVEIDQKYYDIMAMRISKAEKDKGLAYTE